VQFQCKGLHIGSWGPLGLWYLYLTAFEKISSTFLQPLSRRWKAISAGSRMSSYQNMMQRHTISIGIAHLQLAREISK
jgi:hypothetical protein